MSLSLYYPRVQAHISLFSYWYQLVFMIFRHYVNVAYTSGNSHIVSIISPVYFSLSSHPLHFVSASIFSPRPRCTQARLSSHLLPRGGRRKKIRVCRFQCAARAFSVNDQDTCSHPRESSPALLSIDKRSTLNVGDANNEALSEGFVCCAFLTGTSMATLLCARSRHGRRPRPSLWLVDWQDRQRTTRDGRSSKTGLMWLKCLSCQELLSGSGIGRNYNALWHWLLMKLYFTSTRSMLSFSCSFPFFFFFLPFLVRNVNASLFSFNIRPFSMHLMLQNRSVNYENICFPAAGRARALHMHWIMHHTQNEVFVSFSRWLSFGSELISMLFQVHLFVSRIFPSSN